jgi:hypothetical protein
VSVVMNTFQTFTGASSTSTAAQSRRSSLTAGTRRGNAQYTARESSAGCRITGRRSHHSDFPASERAASHQPIIGGWS